jgi:hypothetical protein
LPVFIILGLVGEEFAFGVNEELGGSGSTTKGAVTLATHLVVVVKAGTGMIDITGADDHDVVEFEGAIVLDMDIDDGSIDARSRDIGISDTRIMEAERLSSILHIGDITAVPSTAHGVYLTEFDPNLDKIFQDYFLFGFHNTTKEWKGSEKEVKGK